MPRAPVAAILLAVANALAEGGCLPPPESARAVEAADAFTAGVQLVAAERWTDAERAFLDALALDPGMPLAYYGVGQARMALKRHADAAAAFEQSHEAFVCASRLSADARRASKRRLDDAIRSLRDSLREMDHERLVRGFILGEEVNGDEKPRVGEYARRRDAIENQILALEQLKKRPERGVPPEVWLALGSAYFQMGSLGQAERAFQAALAVDPKSGDAHNDLAVVYMLTGRLDEADLAVKQAEDDGVTVGERLKEEIRQRKAHPPTP